MKLVTSPSNSELASRLTMWMVTILDVSQEKGSSILITSLNL